MKNRPKHIIRCCGCGVEANDEYMSDDDIREGRSLWEELKEEGWVEINGGKYCDDCKLDN